MGGAPEGPAPISHHAQDDPSGIRGALRHEERRIFGSLSMEENILLAELTAPKRWPLGRIYEMFPRLKERRGPNPDQGRFLWPMPAITRRAKGRRSHFRIPLRACV